MNPAPSGPNPALAGNLVPALTILAASVSALTRDLDLDGAARALHDCLKNVAQAMSTTPSMAKGDPVHVTASAHWLVRVEMRMLPPRHRARYTEEFKAELRNLVTARATRSTQVLYALRQLRRVWRLRAALQAPDRPRFHHLHRAARWILASDWRTWGILVPALVAALFNVTESQGWGSAFLAIPAILSFHIGVERLRKRWKVEDKREQSQPAAMGNRDRSRPGDRPPSTTDPVPKLRVMSRRVVDQRSSSHGSGFPS